MRARTWAGLATTSLVVAGLTGAVALAAIRGDGSWPMTGPTPAAATSSAATPPAATPPAATAPPPLPAVPAPAVPVPVVPAPVVPTPAVPAPVVPAPPRSSPPPLALRPPAPRIVTGLPCSLPVVGDGACVSLSRQRAWLVRHGDVVMSVPVQTGKKGSATPVGRFAVLSKDVDHRSREFDDAPMPYSVFFYPGDAFHTGSLSQRSNGCVHLGNAAARTFFSALSVGDPVHVVR